MTIAISDVSAIVEDIYTKGIHYIGLGKDAPLWSRIPKKAGFNEQTLYTRNRYGKNPGFSRTFATARARAAASAFGRFGVTRANDFGSLQFENEALLALGENAERDVSIVKEEGDSVLERSVQRLNDAMYKNHGGWIAAFRAAAARRRSPSPTAPTSSTSIRGCTSYRRTPTARAAASTPTPRW